MYALTWLLKKTAKNVSLMISHFIIEQKTVYCWQHKNTKLLFVCVCVTMRRVPGRWRNPFFIDFLLRGEMLSCVRDFIWCYKKKKKTEKSRIEVGDGKHCRRKYIFFTETYIIRIKY